MGRGRDLMRVRRRFKSTRDGHEAPGIAVVIAEPYR
jgi:hypothetical protein